VPEESKKIIMAGSVLRHEKDKRTNLTVSGRSYPNTNNAASLLGQPPTKSVSFLDQPQMENASLLGQPPTKSVSFLDQPQMENASLLGQPQIENFAMLDVPTTKKKSVLSHQTS
jgi:hypothetical protein